MQYCSARRCIFIPALTVGNVWYLGEDTAEYENGKVVSTEGTWLAGVKGTHPGIIQDRGSPCRRQL